MNFFAKAIAGLAIVTSLGAADLAFAASSESTSATISDPEGPPPDPGHIPFVLPKDIKWTGTPGKQETAFLYGNPEKAGPYAVLYKWYPGAFSHPHFHDQTRWIYVVSGTWWVSSSNTYDEKLTFPFHAGTFSTDVANTVHWDGNRAGAKENAVILLAGVGPVKTIQVDEQGRPN
jgi:hypothetical protein